MNPNDLTAAQLLDATIDHMESRGEWCWYRGGSSRDPLNDERGCFVAHWNATAHQLGVCGGEALNTVASACLRMFGYTIVHLSDNRATDFDDFLSKLRQIKAML